MKASLQYLQNNNVQFGVLTVHIACQEWNEDPAALRAWQRGKTGFPLVDAGKFFASQLQINPKCYVEIEMRCNVFRRHACEIGET